MEGNGVSTSAPQGMPSPRAWQRPEFGTTIAAVGKMKALCDRQMLGLVCPHQREKCFQA